MQTRGLTGGALSIRLKYSNHSKLYFLMPAYAEISKLYSQTSITKLFCYDPSRGLEQKNQSHRLLVSFGLQLSANSPNIEKSHPPLIHYHVYYQFLQYFILQQLKIDLKDRIGIRPPVHCIASTNKLIYFTQKIETEDTFYKV